MFKLGWLLFVIGMIGGMAGAFYMAGSEDALPFLEGYFCQDNETLIRTSTETYDGNAINFYCEKNDGGARTSADGQFFMALGLVFSPLILSIPLIIIGGIRYSRRTQQQVMSGVLGQMQYTDGSGQVFVKSSKIPAGNFTDVNSMINAVMAGAKDLNTSQKLTLKQKLEQLQEAYDSGLITYDELQIRKDRVLDEIAED
ncbi:MAG: SHOCT domain-containing protein [Aggregatilineales bacterium]